MARLVGNILGNLKGKIGNFSARTINGTTFLRMRPSSFKVSNSQKSIESRQRFAITIAFAACVSKNLTLHEIWKPKKKSKMSVYNTIFKRNYCLSNFGETTLNNVITPDGFRAPVIEVNISEGKIIGSLDSLSKATLICSDEIFLSINTVIFLSNPKDESESNNKLFSLSLETNDFDIDQQFDFELDLTQEQAFLVSKYNRKIIYLAIATKSADDKIIQYSNTYSKIAD